MLTKIKETKKLLLVGIILILIGSTIAIACEPSSIENRIELKNHNRLNNYTKEIYIVSTDDGSEIKLTRYVGNKRPSIMLVHGMGVNHKIFDWDVNHSLARFLNNDSWDVWMLDLRTHDGDGDLWFGWLFGLKSDREHINRYWDFDRTLLKKDVVTAVKFIKEKSENETIFFMGHSYGGYLAYAYAEIIGEENLSAILTTGSSGMGGYMDFPFYKYLKYGIKIGNKVFVNPFGRCRLHLSLFRLLFLRYNILNKPNGIFYKDTTPVYIKKGFFYSCDDEPAGVFVDIIYGKHPRLYGDHWVDPQTLYDYTANLHKITVPFLAIVGDEDTDDPMEDVFKTYENVSSVNKKFLHFPKHGHLDLLLGDNSSNLIFPEITAWLDSLV